MTAIRVQVAPRVGPAYPLGSRIGAAVFMALWRGLAALGRRTPRRGKSAAQDAQGVRVMAWGLQSTDPRFAADLLAAADRHERLHGVQ